MFGLGAYCRACLFVQFKQGSAGLIQTARQQGARFSALSHAYNFANLMASGCTAAAVKAITHS